MIDFEKICARNGIALRTFQESPGLEEAAHLGGACIAYDGVSLILYDGAQTEVAQQFTLAHELAHNRLHHALPRPGAEAVYGTDLWREIEANIYAVVMLAVGELLTA